MIHRKKTFGMLGICLLAGLAGGIPLQNLQAQAVQGQDRQVKQQKMQATEIELDSIFLSPEFKVDRLGGIEARLAEKEYYVLDKGVLNKHIRQRNGKEKVVEILDSASDSRFSGMDWAPVSFEFNADHSKVLLLSGYEAIYRRSALYNAVVWSLDKKGKASHPVVLSQEGKIQEVTFSPDGSKVSYLRDNNLYYRDLVSGQEVQVTTDGAVNKIRNGHTDWVYEEEFAFTKAYAWNPASTTIAYLKFDESALKEYEMTIWGDLYPETYRYKYPKAGERNSEVSLWFYDLASGKNAPADLKADSVEYIPRIFWEPTGKELLVYTLNRHQNHWCIWAMTPQGGQRLVYEERNPAYVDITDNVYFFKDGSKMLLATEKDGYNHLYLFPMDGSDSKGTLLTPGPYDVTALYGVDEAKQRVFFQAAYTSPSDRDLMCVNLDGTGLRRPALDMQRRGGFTDAWFNADFTYMIVEHSDANTAASYYLYHVGDEEDQLLECLLENTKLDQTAKKYGYVQKEFLRIPVPLTGEDANAFMGEPYFGMHRYEQKTKGAAAPAPNVFTKSAMDLSGLAPEAAAAEGVSAKAPEARPKPVRQVYLNAWIMKPAEIGTPEAEGKKYPVLMFLYGGPGSQQVLNSMRPYEVLDYAWYQMLVQKGYIVVCVDNRGTGSRGEAFKKCTYLQLGKYETQDQIAAAKVLGSLPYVDASRIGIWGWSYGGFMSSNCLFQGHGVFKAAMAVAPVTNWRYYDNVYTERFMRTPQENAQGYDGNSPISHVSELQGAYLLVHGSADDNVHFQNSVDLLTALQKAGKQFEFVMYPNRNHSMVGKDGSSRQHLYHKLTGFLLNNL